MLAFATAKRTAETLARALAHPSHREILLRALARARKIYYAEKEERSFPRQDKLADASNGIFTDYGYIGREKVSGSVSVVFFFFSSRIFNLDTIDSKNARFRKVFDDKFVREKKLSGQIMEA